MTRQAAIWMMSALSIAAVAGCATPEEATPPPSDIVDEMPGIDIPGVDDTTPEPEPDVTTPSTPEYIVVSGRAYECDDTLDADGICDAYTLDESADVTAIETTAMAEADGSIMVAGHQYVCEHENMMDVDMMDEMDDAGACASWQRPGTVE